MTAIRNPETSPIALTVRLPPGPGSGRLRRGALIGTAASVAFVVSVAGGYAAGWEWTGFSTNDTLWDWLHLMLLPASLSALPLWWRAKPGAGPRARLAASVAVAVFAVVVAGGYGLRWDWTGFVGNRVWEWLNLLLLPLAVAALPIWVRTRQTRERQWRAGFFAAGVVLAVLIVGGYGLGWSWTGFGGNRLWDWIRLLLVPVAVPAACAWVDAKQQEIQVLRAAAARHLLPGAVESGSLPGSPERGN